MREPQDSRMQGEARDTWTVVVAYENSATRQQAVEFCNYLTHQYWADVEFDFSWWSFAELRSPATAEDAAVKAGRADMIVLALGTDGELASEARAWTENLLRKRGTLEGALVSLFEPATGASAQGCSKDTYLRKVAHRGGMDYLSHAAPASTKGIPDSIESYNQRAGQVTSVLDEILQNQPGPPQFPSARPPKFL